MAKVNGLAEMARKFDAISKAYNRLPAEVSTIAVRFSKNRFVEQSWYDEHRERWKPLKRRRPGTGSQTILVKTGRLKRSIRKIYADNKRVIIGTDVPYAPIHNDGGTINKLVTVKAHTRKNSRTRKGRPVVNVKTHRRKMNTTIPKRQFLGNSERLNRELFLHIETQLENALKS